MKALYYNIQTKDYQLAEIEKLAPFIEKQTGSKARRVYIMQDYPAKAIDNTLLGYKNATNPTDADQSGNTSFGSDTYTSLISLRNELKVDSMVGVRQVSSTLTMGTPVVKEC